MRTRAADFDDTTGGSDQGERRSGAPPAIRRLVAIVSTRSRAVVVVSATIAGMMLSATVATSAWSLEWVYLNNGTNEALTEESPCILVGDLTCPGEWSEGAVLKAHQENPGIRLPLQISVGPDDADGIHFEDTWGPRRPGHFEFVAIDPVDTSAFIEKCEGDVTGWSCSIVNERFAYIHEYASASGGLLGASPSVEAHFAAGLAPVRSGGTALLPVAASSTATHGSIHEHVVLKTKSGKVIGGGKGTVSFGHRTDIDVRLAAGIARTIAGGHVVHARASVKIIGGVKGSGQTTTIELAKLTSALGHVLGISMK